MREETKKTGNKLTSSDRYIEASESRSLLGPSSEARERRAKPKFFAKNHGAAPLGCTLVITTALEEERMLVYTPPPASPKKTIATGSVISVIKCCATKPGSMKTQRKELSLYDGNSSSSLLTAYLKSFFEQAS